MARTLNLLRQKPTVYHTAMTAWLRARTLFQGVALSLAILAVGAVIFSYFSGGSSSGVVTLALLACYIAFRKELLWRVRNRLIVTYVLFGLVPLFLFGLLTITAIELLLGQFAGVVIRRDLEARIANVRSAAENLSLAASLGAQGDLLNGMRQRLPRLAAVVGTKGEVLRFPANGQIRNAPAWMPLGFVGVFRLGGQYFIGARVRDTSSETFAYLPLDEQTLDSLAPGVVSVAAVLGSNDFTNFNFGPFESKISLVRNGTAKEMRARGLGPPRGWWDVTAAGMLTWKVRTPSGSANILLPLVARPSSLASGGVTGRMESVAFSMMVITGIFFLFVEVVSLLSSWKLTRAITQSVDNLYKGTLQVAEGDFANRIPVRGNHQLSALSTSFNSMTAKTSELIGEVKKKEKLDAELEIARQVQLRLFPKSAPLLNSLQIAAVCNPGRIVSGDYYDYVALDDDRLTAIALGDVSGKGVSAALLMASIQSALHAQLKFGKAASGLLSTASLMELISQQLYENTPPEKYATFFCSIYDDATGRLNYTNAGHLKPILVRGGQSTLLEGDGMVVGLLPNVTFEEHYILLEKGDLLAIFSDGIPEAEDAAAREFGENRLAELLVAQASEPLDRITSVVTRAVEKWIHDPETRDDLTLLLLRKL